MFPKRHCPRRLSYLLEALDGAEGQADLRACIMKGFREGQGRGRGGHNDLGPRLTSGRRLAAAPVLPPISRSSLMPGKIREPEPADKFERKRAEGMVGSGDPLGWMESLGREERDDAWEGDFRPRLPPPHRVRRRSRG